MPCGGDSASSRLSVARSNGLCGATQGANIAPARPTASTAADTSATGERRKLYARSPLGPASFDHGPLLLVDVVGQLDQVDVLLDSPGERLLVQRQGAEFLAVDLEQFGDHRIALGLVELAGDG